MLKPRARCLFLYCALALAAGEVFLWLQRRVMSEAFRTIAKRAVLPLLTPVIILGGILGGIATPTEASALAVGLRGISGAGRPKNIKIFRIV